jgi:hypothetical protein
VRRCQLLSGGREAGGALPQPFEDDLKVDGDERKARLAEIHGKSAQSRT